MKKLTGPVLVLFVLLGAAISNALVPTLVPAPPVLTAEAPPTRPIRAASMPRVLACGGSGTNLTAPTWGDVAACHTAAPNAATITVSSGSYTVTTTTTITKFVKIICASVCTLTDNVADVADLINITESTAGSTRLEGFTFVSGTGQHSNPNGIVKLVHQTGGKPLLITGNVFTLGTTGDAIIAGVNRGVIWNNTASATWIDDPGVRCSNNAAFVRHKNTALTAVWTEAPYYGTDDTDGQHNLYIETNTLDNVFEGIDVDANGRNVTRYNTIINSGVLNHGADTGTIAGRYIDIYNNTFVWSTTSHCAGSVPASVDSFITLRGAPALIHGNTIPHISSMAWGSKSEVKFYNEQLRRNAGPYACWNSGYPSPYQVGWGYVSPLVQAGSSGVFMGLEGVYLWTNSGAGNYGSPAVTDYSPNECGGGAPLVSTYIQSGRDYFTATAKPSYTAYPYPHPLTFSTIYYTNKAGSNGNSCATAQSSVDTDAKLTVAAGIACLSSGDELDIGDGVYVEAIRNTILSGSSGAPTIIKAENANGVILRPSGGFYVVELTDTETSYITFDGLDADGINVVDQVYYMAPDSGTVNNIRIINGTARNSQYDGSFGGANIQCGGHSNVLGAHHIEVSNMEITGSENDPTDGSGGYGLYIACHDSLFENNNVHDNEGYAVHQYTTHGSGVNDNIIRSNVFNMVGQQSGAGAILISAGDDNLYYNNLIYNSNTNGFFFYSMASGTGVFYNTLYANAGTCIVLNSGSVITSTVIRNNICYSNGSDSISDGGSGTITSNNLLGPNPLFTNAAAGNFIISSVLSPAVNAGTPVAGITTDYAGNTRSTTTPTIGAYEFNAAPPTIDTFYVAKTGSDANSCMAAQTSTTPKLTITAGITCMSAGDTLFIGNGTYVESNLNPPAGSAGATTKITALNRNQVIVAPTTGFAAFFFSGSYVTVDGIDANCANRGTTCGPYLYNNSFSPTHITIQHGTARNAIGPLGSGIELGPGTGHLIWDNDVTNNGTDTTNDHGIFLYGTSNTVVGNRVSGSAANGINLTLGGDGASGTQSTGMVIRENRIFSNLNRSAILLSRATSPYLYNNLLYSNGGYGIELSGATNVTPSMFFNDMYANTVGCAFIIAGTTTATLRNNICFQNAVDTITNNGGGTIASNNILGANPNWVNAPGGNFNLTALSSNAIGLGVAVTSPSITTDFDGTSRTNPPDIGAYQYAAPPPGNITVVSPNTGVRTATGLNVTLTGQGTSWVNGVTVCSFSGTGITVNSTTVSSSQSGVCNITIAANATLGARTVNMTTVSSVSNRVDGFTVLTAPTITSATPSSGVRSQTLNVALVGSNTNWSQGVSAGSFSGTGVTVNSTTVSSATAATLNISISPTATLGLRNVIMTTAGSTATLTNGFTVNQVPTKLGYIVQPPASTASGATMTPSIQVAVQFADSTTSTTSTNSITVALCSGSPAGTLSGTLTRAAVAGIATFNNLAVTSLSGNTGYTLCATATGLTSATSNSFTITGLGPATKLGFTTQPPTTINSGAAIPNVVVAVQFSNSTTDPSSTATVTLAICGGSPAGTLSGTLVRNAVAGVATFSGLSLTSMVGGPGYTLCATSAPLTSATSNSFTVNVPVQPPTKLGVTTQPPTSVASGATLSNVVVAVQFADGSTSTTSTNGVTISICGGSPAGTLTGTLTRNAVAGLATFNNLVITTVNGGAGYTLCAIASGLTSAVSDSFTVVGLGPATKVGFTTQPPATVDSGVVISTTRVSVQFSNSTTDTSSTASITVAICGGSPAGTLTGTLSRSAVAGVAAFNDLVITSVLGGAGYTLCATSSPLTPSISDSFTVNVPVPVPTQLGFTTQPPSSVVSGVVMSDVVAAVQFASGVTDNTATNTIVLTLCNGTGTISGTLTRNAVNGLATFNNLVVTSAGGGSTFRLCVTSSGLTSATSDNFTVTVPPPTATNLRVAVQPPSSVLSGTVLSAVNIAVAFSNGSTDTSATNSVTIALCSGSPAGTLSGTLVKNATAGIASFNNLAITSTLGGAGYTLCATAVNLTSTTTNSFTVNVPADACTTNPLIITKVSWPTGQTGSRSLGYNSGGFSVAGISFTYPGTALFTDTRGCQTTVLKN